jgi:sulfur relay (sulfurtransferase) complex TusBCD TusD component (DsrE family)
MSLRGKKLGILISCTPQEANFSRGLRLAEAALAQDVDVYLYCIDEAVPGIGNTKLQALKGKGLKVYACAYGANRRNLPLNDNAVFAGLTVVSDLIAATDKFVAFN